MTRRTKLKQEFRTIEIPANPINDGRLIMAANIKIQDVLARARLCELEGIIVPEEEGGVYRRRIVLVKRPKEKGEVYSTDLPDLEDVQLTDLPWMGDITFKAASRQFKAKNQFACAVEIVRQYGNYLYILSDGLSPATYKDTKPSILNVVMPTRRNAFYTITRDSIMSEEEISSITQYPSALVSELAGLGYTLTDEGFILPTLPKGVPSRHLTCYLYGRLQTVKDSSTCLLHSA